MTKRVTVIVGVISLWGSMLVARAERVSGEQYPQKAETDVPTFAKVVAPILYKNCTSCHRPGEIGPMELI